MRYFRIFLLHLQQTLEQRSYMLVYFIMSVINPFLFVLFWRGATAGGKTIAGWTFSDIASYYFYFAILIGLLVAHPEYVVSRRHIKEGNLVMFLLKPMSYLLQIFFMEFSWRFVRFWFGVFTIIIFLLFWHTAIVGLHNSLLEWLLIIIVCSLGFIVSFTMKMVMGICAFWITDTVGFFDLMEVVMIVFGGSIMPLALFPSIISSVIILLPFAYIIYFPVIVLQGKIPIDQIAYIIFMQLFWSGIFLATYQFLWRKGLQKFTAVGQ